MPLNSYSVVPDFAKQILPLDFEYCQNEAFEFHIAQAISLEIIEVTSNCMLIMPNYFCSVAGFGMTVKL